MILVNGSDDPVLIMNNRLLPVSKTDIRPMMGWFEDKQALLQWSGPDFAYPFTEASFYRDLKLQKCASYGLISDVGELVAFGQFYRRLNRCHLGRLVVSPVFRGQGVAQQLIESLTAIGCDQLGVNQVSLFVLSNNSAAISAYEKAGFEITPYPEQMPLDDCFYMIRTWS